MNPRPCLPGLAVARVRLLVQSAENEKAGYSYGGGDYHPDWHTPWTTRNGIYGGDCRVPFLWGYQIPADRPGYNHGPWSTVEDCVSYNSLVEDSMHARDLVVPVADAPREGDVLAYATVHVTTHEDGVPVEHTFIGHGAVVVGVSRWDGKSYASLDIVQVCGPAKRTPAAIISTGAHFDTVRPVAKWPKPEHQVHLLRVKT